MSSFIGLDNFEEFIDDPSLTSGLRNTFVYAVVTSVLKVVLGLLLATLLTSRIHVRSLVRSIIFFPVLISTVAVGITFAVLMHPSEGLINKTLAVVGVDGPAWLERSGHRLAIGGPRGRLEGRRDRDRHLHRRDRFHP